MNGEIQFDFVDADEYERLRSVYEPLTQSIRRAIGLRNAMAPPMEIHQDGQGRHWSEFTLGEAYEGPPGLVHGGIGALVFDHILGEAGTPLGPLRAEAYIERTEGFFIRPAWARDAGGQERSDPGVVPA